MEEGRKATMWAEVRMGKAVDTIAVTHLGMDVGGVVSLMGEDSDGRPFAIQLGGADSAGRSLAACLVELAGQNEKHTGTGGL